MGRVDGVLREIRELLARASHDAEDRAALANCVRRLDLRDLASLDVAARHFVTGRPGRFPISSDEDRIYVGLLACHPSGYVRESAVEALAEDGDGRSLPFLLLRTVDWVDPVRTRAERAVLARMTAGSVVDSLGLVERLARHSRFSPQLRVAIDALLRDPMASSSLRRGLTAPSLPARREAFRYAAMNSGLSLAEVLDCGSRDLDVALRLWAFRFPGMDAAWYAKAAGDSCAAIRRLAIPALGPEHFLLDRSAGVRRECQAAISMPAGIYREALMRTIRAEAVLGLGETGGREDVGLLAPLLTHGTPSVRVAAVRALRQLGLASTCADALWTALQDASPAVVREATSALLGERLGDPERIWEMAKPSMRLLRLFRNAPKWARLRIYLRAGREDWLRAWLREFNRSFARLPVPERVWTLALLEQAQPRLADELVGELRFAVETAHS